PPARPPPNSSSAGGSAPGRASWHASGPWHRAREVVTSSNNRITAAKGKSKRDSRRQRGSVTGWKRSSTARAERRPGAGGANGRAAAGPSRAALVRPEQRERAPAPASKGQDRERRWYRGRARASFVLR